MIKINMLSPEKQALNKAVFEALAEIRSRSYSGRNPSLGKMLNCSICGNRHREVRMFDGKVYRCELKYAKGSRYDMLPEDQKKPMILEPTTIKQLLGAQRFAKKRKFPHHSKHDLQLVQRTQQLYPQHERFLSEPVEIMKEARNQARRELKKERFLENKFRRRQTDISRRINLGLEKPGMRP